MTASLNLFRLDATFIYLIYGLIIFHPRCESAKVHVTTYAAPLRKKVGTNLISISGSTLSQTQEFFESLPYSQRKKSIVKYIPNRFKIVQGGRIAGDKGRRTWNLNCKFEFNNKWSINVKYLLECNLQVNACSAAYCSTSWLPLAPESGAPCLKDVHEKQSGVNEH